MSNRNFYHGCGPSESPLARTNHSFWVYPASKPTVYNWHTHLPVGLHCNNHFFVGTCEEDMTLTEFECLGHDDIVDSAVVYTGALPLSRSNSDIDDERHIEELVSLLTTHLPPFSQGQQEQQEQGHQGHQQQEQEQQEQGHQGHQEQEQEQISSYNDLVERITRLERSQEYYNVYRIVTELFALLVLCFYVLRNSPSRNVDVDL